VDREGELPTADALRLVTQVVDALAYAHAQGVVHRDIKPDNVLLSGRNALVMDFGIAKAMRDAGGTAVMGHTMTQAGMSMGTPACMAPVQAMADPAMDHRVDLCAMGVMAYELLTARLPFEAASPQAMLAAHLTQPPVTVATSTGANIWRLPIPASGSVSAYQAQPVTTGSQVIEGMAVSGDGQWVVYDADVQGNFDSYRIPAAGGAAQQLTATPWDEFAPSLAPDNGWVAYHSFRNGTRDIEVQAVGGGAAVRVTDSKDRQESYPRWSPDGTRLVFHERRALLSHHW
jgi:serine/threonine protein kinase